MALTDNLVAFWELEEASGTRVDATGRGNDLTDNNTVLQGTGKVGNCADFELSNSEYLSRADNADLSVGDIDFTIAAWVKLESLVADAAIVAKGGVNDLSYGLDVNSGTTKFRFRVSSAAGFTNLTGVDATTFGVVSETVWYFVVAWHDATANTINIQVNDGTVDSTSYSAGSYDGSAEFRIGAFDFYGAYWDGLIDQVGLWKRTLTSGERTSLYNGGSGLSYAAMGSVGSGGKPDAYYRMMRAS